MYWRQITEGDLQEFFFDCPTAFGAELIGEAAAWNAWRNLLSWPGFNGAVVEKRTPGRPAERFAAGASVFVSEAFAHEEISNPRPGLNGRVLAEFTRRTGNVLAPQQIAEDNASDGLNVLVLFGRPLRKANEEEAAEAALELATSFVELHAGYRFRRTFIELKDSVDIHHALSTRVYTLIPYGSQTNITSETTALGVVSSEAVAFMPGSMLTALFRPRTPQLALRVTDQELLRAALKGSTDAELARHLKISIAAVKRRWEDIYRNVAGSDLPISATFKAKSAEGKRGAQKRHLLLEYLRQHREELRPFAHKRRSIAAAT